MPELDENGLPAYTGRGQVLVAEHCPDARIFQDHCWVAVRGAHDPAWTGIDMRLTQFKVWSAPVLTGLLNGSIWPERTRTLLYHPTAFGWDHYSLGPVWTCVQLAKSVFGLRQGSLMVQTVPQLMDFLEDRHFFRLLAEGTFD